ncbi:MAG: hypothetical protein AAGG56_17205 [Pseudomonadota bacterium]
MDIFIDWFLNLPPAGQTTLVAALVSALVGLVVAFTSPFASRRLERLKAELNIEVEELKASLAQEASLNNARTSYEFDAKKRLYSEIEPLFFSLFEATEGSYYRVASLVRTQRQGHLGKEDGSWLAREGYYLRSTIYRLFLPLAIFRLIQRSATFVDIELDDNIRTRYFLLKLSYYALTDDFVLAKLVPSLAYAPNVPDWKEKILEQPAKYARQGLVIGHMDRLIDALLVDDRGSRRPIDYGEFEQLYRDDQDFIKAVKEPTRLFLNFDFLGRPVLARALLAHSFAMRLLLYTYSHTSTNGDLGAVLRKFCQSDEAKADLDWRSTEFGEISSSVAEYVDERLSWIEANDYDIR